MLLQSLRSDHGDLGADQLQMGRNRPEPNGPQVAGALGSLGRIDRNRGHVDQAPASFKQ